MRQIVRIGDACSCCGDLLQDRFDRRRFLRLAGGAGFASLLPGFAFAGYGQYDAMVLSCIDPRFPERTLGYMKQRDLLGTYSQFVIAGASVGVVAPAFKDWHKAFWDNLAASVDLHRIKRVIALNHRDCGAARIAYGAASVAERDAETRTHANTLAEFRKQVGERQPNLSVETGLMALDGTVEMLG